MEETFTKVVQHVFSCWSALKLAVEHSMAGPNSKQAAIDCMNYMVQYCLYESNVQIDDISEALEDLLDEEFNTICEDNSEKEVAGVLYKFAQIIKSGNESEFTLEYQKLPPVTDNWLQNTQTQTPKQIESSCSSSEEETAMEEDTEWTQVKSRRKKR